MSIPNAILTFDIDDVNDIGARQTVQPRATIALDSVLGNQSGKAVWGLQGITKTARNIRIHSGRYLEAALETKTAVPNWVMVDLTTHLRYDKLKNAMEYFDDQDLRPAVESQVLKARYFFDMDTDYNIGVHFVVQPRAVVDLDSILGNRDGQAVWGLKGISRSAGKIRIEGHILKTTLTTMSRTVVPAEVDLAAHIRYNFEGNAMETYDMPSNVG
ncbi:hypothetical protein CALCODRAFT_193304 [Calocera cornea HHB12733]|uniref:Uncharacterized protein n=1 Tax=Calocera cornea HHB12733 TaxID=1353952 RepID=A0A165C7G0_9BASI|nr:hypothetical protein CALCODRAFT_193304 [Calocera cornea HHB12733]